MSFIDLMGNDVWSEADIKSRLHQEIRSAVSELAETELNRALQGAALGLHDLSDAEMASLGHFKQATDRVAALGTQARADMALLRQVLPLELAQQRLALPPVEAPLEEAVSADYEADVAQRAAAQAVVDGASTEALALALLRNPVPDPADPALPDEPPVPA